MLITGVDIIEIKRVEKVASSYGIKTWTVKKPNELKKIISEAIKYKKGPCLIDIISQPLEEAKAPVSEWIA